MVIDIASSSWSSGHASDARWLEIERKAVHVHAGENALMLLPYSYGKVKLEVHPYPEKSLRVLADYAISVKSSESLTIESLDDGRMLVTCSQREGFMIRACTSVIIEEVK